MQLHDIIIIIIIILSHWLSRYPERI